MKRFLLFLLLLCPISATARVISYAPYSDQLSMRGYHDRTTRYFVLVEGAAANVYDQFVQHGTVVLYDSTGAEPPRAIFGPDTIRAAALYQRRASEPPTVLVITGTRTVVSRNGGRSWRRIAELDSFELREKDEELDVDRGGPWTQGLAVPVRIGSGQYPFVVDYDEGVYAISATGAPRLLVSAPAVALGSNREGTKFLVLTGGELVVTDLKGRWKSAGPVKDPFGTRSGWIAPNGDVYAIEQYDEDNASVFRYTGGHGKEVGWASFAVPAHDFNGFWSIQLEHSRTVLLHYTPANGYRAMWVDEDAPEVEALHAGASSNTLLIQVHRERAKQELPFLDPALAIWRIGEPAPAEYDELFLNEGPAKGFVHLDVDKAADGEPFVFDSSFIRPPPPDIVVSPPISGANDVIQEWGVVRASLEQRLVIQGVSNETQITDLVIYNPLDAPQRVDVEFGDARATITLPPNRIEVFDDVLDQLFDVTATGTLHLLPEHGVNAFAHVHAAGARHGHIVQAVDFMNAASPRFPVTFSAATGDAQLIVSDTSGQGIDADMTDKRIVRPVRGSLIAGMQLADTVTGDTIYFTPDLPASSIRALPLLMNEANLHSDLHLFNYAATPRRITIEVTPYEGGAWPRQQTYTLQAYESRVFRNVLQLFHLTGKARLRYWSPGAQGDATGVRVASRMYTTAANGGTYGTAIPPLNSFQSVTAGESLEIHGLRSGYRASLGLVELSPNPRNLATSVRISVYDQIGALIDKFDQVIRPAGGVFIDDLFKGKPQPQVCRVVIEARDDWSLVGAYALLTDPTTNDPTYLGAQLGATSK